MKLSTLSVIALSTVTAAFNDKAARTSHHGKTHHVDVGTFGGEVKFVPNQIDALIGDTVFFNFLAKSHSLTQSDFKTPCTSNGRFDTGLNQANPKNESGLFVIPFHVKTEQPQWFYCKQQGPPNHCGKGMVFGLNPAGKMDKFIQNAIAQNGADKVPDPASGTYPAQQTVTAGLDKGKTLRYSPEYLPHVTKGSKIHFDFRAANHTLTESSFDAPCTPLRKRHAIDTGFNHANPDDIPNLKPFHFTAHSNKPRYFYCRQGSGTAKSHCANGMVFAINVNQEKFTEFQARAMATLPKIRGRGPV
ncbi:hypothetical protein AJ78_06016 [Emergomyces pasteurianus Ep9510]|uniref:Phytocyanin domain-containing protein n=1 Tax=Emergomyces pasteurianus Ep9510 TaxID=1447872 RepID=A0A1J9QC87_9EURO|nr:hypothetical protein AJ78_06016 [Emergomyces pasteurianus Ep9510]